jgi:hypothetical protein
MIPTPLCASSSSFSSGRGPVTVRASDVWSSQPVPWNDIESGYIFANVIRYQCAWSFVQTKAEAKFPSN